MGSFSIWHWFIVLVVILILFGGGGKLSRLMGDMAKGVNAFKKGLKEKDDDADTADDPHKQIKAEQSAAPAEAPKKDQAAKG